MRKKKITLGKSVGTKLGLLMIFLVGWRMRKGRLESQLVQLWSGLVQLGMNKNPDFESDPLIQMKSELKCLFFCDSVAK